MNITTLIKKHLSWEKMYKYEEDELRDKLRDKADTIFAKYIRTRDRNKDCITHDVDTCSHKIENACHCISRGWYSHRRDENNVYGWCVSCNKRHAQDHWSCFKRVMIDKFGIEYTDEQERIKNKIPPTIDELLEIIDKYTEKLKCLVED